MISMLKYMEEQDVICRNIITNRKTILKDFLSKISSKKQNKWIFLATGSSLNAVNSAKMYIEYISGIEVEVRIPSEFSTYSKLWDKDATIFGVSQSGRSTSTIEAIGKTIEEGHRGLIFGITANEGSTLTKVSPNWIKIDCGEEKIGFVTKGVSSTTLTLMLMGLEVSFLSEKISEEQYLQNIQELSKAVDLMGEALGQSKEWYKKNKEEISSLTRAGIITFGAPLGSAKEAETKLTETVRCPCTGYDMEEFIHGPNYEVNANYHLFFIGIEHPLEERLLQIKHVYTAYSPHSFYIGWNQNLKDDARNIVFSKSLNEFICPLVVVVPFQYLSHQLATDRGTDLTIRLQTELDKHLQRKVEK